MNKPQKYILEKEIEYWTRHQELDKFNYNDMSIRLLGILSFAVALWAGLIQLFPSQSLILTNIFIVFLLISFLIAFNSLARSNLHFIVREEMIKDRYEILKVNKKKLNEEFEIKYKKQKEEWQNNLKERFTLILIIALLLSLLIF